MRICRIAAVCLLSLAAVQARAQYVGKVGQANLDQKPVLRATAVYQYTGSETKPNASRLVPVVVWDGTSFQPGGLYLAQPEPLAVAPGTQYVLTPDGVPSGLFNVLSAAQQNGAWVALGRYAVPAPQPVPKLRASRELPVLHGGREDRDTDDAGGPVLHRKAGSAGDAQSSSGSSSGNSAGSNGGSPSSSGSGGSNAGNGPVLHRRDSGSSSGGSPNAGASAGSAPAPDPDRPTLHRPSSGSADSGPTALDPDRPVLHKHAGPAVADDISAPDPDRPHLRYGLATEKGPVLPVLLETEADLAKGTPVVVSQVVAISDTASDEPHSFAYDWPSPGVKADAQQALHAVALKALVTAISASFGPAAAADREVREAAAAQTASFGPAAQAATKSTAGSTGKSVGGKSTAAKRRTAAAPAAPPTDPLLDPEFHAFTLSYGGGTAWVYSTHTRIEGPQRRYVTVIAVPDFYGKPQVLFTQTTRGDSLDETPALHIIDAVDADGDHRAELLFAEQSTPDAQVTATRQFALFRVANGEAREVYSTGPSAQQ